ncbi:MAG: DUF2079 domain-containing protein [Thermoplasmata archaeon]|nr:DUF2079 domain-containing protein [Thermoplasmata archaeon]
MRIGGARRARAYFPVAGLLAGVYTVLWASISTLMERTFNLSIWDVGANYVLTNMSSPPGLDYGHLKSAPQNLIYLAFTPLTRVFPNPMALVYAEDVLMGVGGIFIFLIAAEAWGSRPRALIVEGLYLFNYSLFGAAFYPNHYEVLFSVFFPIAYFLHLRNRPAAAAVFLTIAALTSSLGAIMAGLFVGLLLGPRFVSELRGRGLGLRRFFADQRFAVTAGAAALAIFILPFVVQGPEITLSYSHLAGNPSSPSLLGGLEQDVSAKVIGLLLLIIPFLPVIRRSRYVFLTLPYLPLALLSKADHYAQFSYQYLYIIGAVLFVSWIEALRFRYAAVPLPRTAPILLKRTEPRTRRWRLPDGIRREPELFQVGLFAVALGSVVLPYSPGNAFAGGYYSIPFRNYQIHNLVTITPLDQALWDMVQRVPENASVLIQENMPVLTNRAVWFEPGSYHGEAVQFALTDPASFWFDYPPPLFIGPYTTRMITWVNDLLQNGSYAIVEEYEGAMLLERGHPSGLVSFTPVQNYEPGVAFRGANATFPSTPPGTVHVTRLVNGSALLRTEGPQILPPGHYSLSFWLSATNATPADHLSLGIFRNQTAPQPLATRPIAGSTLAPDGSWTLVTLDFTLPIYEDGVYFGLTGDWSDGLSLKSVYLNQTTTS